MKIITDLDQIHIDKPSVVTIGKFDGFHKGHQKLLDDMKRRQQEDGLLIVVFTFDIPPAAIVGTKEKKVLMTREEKRRIFQALGVDVLVEFQFTAETAATPAEKFVSDILKGKLNASVIVAGSDCSFGKHGKGNINLLLKMAKEYQYEVAVIEKECYLEQEISSTIVREAVEAGNMGLCRQLSGRPYFVSGCVRHGRKLGRTLGMPTINLIPDEEKLLPPNGVYFSHVNWRGKIMQGITNIGYKPSVGGERQLGIETYLYDFDGDLYGEWLTVFFLQFLRREQKFDSIERLKQQMEQDILEGRKYHTK